MANDYLCPLCRGHMRLVSNIVISVKSKSHEKGLMFLDPKIGDYTKITHPSFKITAGDEYTIYCPICHAKLNVEDKHNLAKIIMVDEDGNEYDVFFSNIAEEQCTYVVKDKQIEEAGPNADIYRKYFDVPEEDRKYL